MLRKRMLIAITLVLAVSVAGAWAPDDIMKVKSVGNVQVSPDGRRVAFTVTEHVLEADKSEQRTHIWLARADGSDSFQLTRGEKSCSSPRWSPDGKWIAFTSERSGKNNIWLIPADGGEAEPITDLKSGLGGFAWSNSGRWIAFTAPTDTSAEDEKKQKEKSDWKVVDSDYKLHRLWVAPLEKNAEGKRPPRQLTRQDFHVDSTSFDWSPDDRKIAFTHTPTPRVNDWPRADISEVDVESGQVRAVAGTAAAENDPLYAPDGRWIAYAATDIPPTWGRTVFTYVVPAGGGTPRALADTFDRQPNLVGWTADGRALIVQEIRGTASALYRLPLDGPPVLLYSPAEGTFFGTALNRARNMLGFAAQAPATAPEAFVMAIATPSPVRVSRVNADRPKLALGRTTVIRWKGPGGLDIEGLLTYPADYQEGKRYPLLVVIHGGPAGVFVQSFIASPSPYPLAAFASRGYAVLRANIRGSSGYGRDFRYANYGDWGGKDYQDLMAGVDHVIALGVADPERLGVMGWSYGGFMTSWVVTQTRRFKAASAGAAVTNLFSFTGTADIPGFLPDYFGAEPWDKLEPYVKHSAMFNVKGVTTPTLVQHGAADDRVPLSQGQEFYNALVRQGVTARMVVYPRTPHGPREPKFIRHLMQENLDWFDKHVKGGAQ